MSTQTISHEKQASHVASTIKPYPRIALLGIGVVGSRWLQRTARLLPKLSLALVANSQRLYRGDIPPATVKEASQFNTGGEPNTLELISDWIGTGGIVVDATASELVAAKHAEWLSKGIHVVTANKLGCGTSLQRYQQIQQAQLGQQVRYSDAATVGAGLPMLSTLRSFIAGGDQLLELQGILSGTLAWLLAHFDGQKPFSELVKEAQQLGFTEPDPRCDLSGEDVLRKLLILSRTAGLKLDRSDISLTPLLSAQQTYKDMDQVMQQRYEQVAKKGEALRYLAQVNANGKASVGLQSVSQHHPFAGSGSNNRLLLETCRYHDTPILIEGPGAGAEVTAGALLDAVIDLCG